MMDDFVISPSPYFGHVSRYPRWTNAEMKTRTLGHTLLKIHRFNSQWTKYTIVCAESMSSMWNIFVSFPKWRVEHLLSKQPIHRDPWRWKKHIFFSVFASKTNANLGVSKNNGTTKWMVKIRENPMNKWMIWRVRKPLFLVQHPSRRF